MIYVNIMSGMDLEPSINSFKFLPSEFISSQLGVWSMVINSRYISNLLGIGWGQKSDRHLSDLVLGEKTPDATSCHSAPQCTDTWQMVQILSST